MKSAVIREAFLAYFSQHDHLVVPSASLVPGEDKTLLFTNAGMVPFKDHFLGIVPPVAPRMGSVQRCVRAGGKHNDLDNVGFTARHHTFFEMLGNFSFGDYFKREAIRFAWDFLTHVLCIPAEKLWITVYQDDEEAANIWLNEVGVSPARFSRCGEQDNFWSMGDTGPCGPCTELFYDHGEQVAGGPPGSPTADGDRYVEIWNLVFMQYNRDKMGQLTPLPKPSVDTGMGLERIAAVMQGVQSNYDTDIFQLLIQAIVSLGAEVTPTNRPSFNVIADHLRACAFLIADGVVPSNEGRGYVLRRILRRAIRHGHQLGLPTPFLSQLLPTLLETMGDAYPILIAAKEDITRLLNQEEQQFAKTIAQGMLLLEEAMKEARNGQLSGDVAFKLYDTYGFPLDLTEDLAKSHHLTVDTKTFEKAMDAQRAQSQAASAFTRDEALSGIIDFSSVFHGYEKEHHTATIEGLWQEGASVKRVAAGDNATIVLNETPFYGESGGQVGDRGVLETDTAIFDVMDTQKQGLAILHHGVVREGQLAIGDTVKALVDDHWREGVRWHHTGTHLLHAALKEILGSQVQQKGSRVESARARFDFSYDTALSAETLAHVENWINAKIRSNDVVETDEMSIEKAKSSGAVALFGEKYGETVRVLSMGAFSKELCGGTHARRTGDLGCVKIIAEYGIASGVRRIDFVAGSYALDWIAQQLTTLQTIAEQLKTTPVQASEKLLQLQEMSRQQEKRLLQSEKMIQKSMAQSLLFAVETIEGVHMLITQVDVQTPQALRTLLDSVRDTLSDAIIVLLTVNDDKLHVVASVSRTLLDKVPPASWFVQQIVGKGGGRPDMAQGGGPVPDNLEKRLADMKSSILSPTSRA